MRKIKNVVCAIALASIAVVSAVPVVSFALPTSYYGHRNNLGSGSYSSYTYSNGYEAGGNVQNTVMAEMTGTSSSRRSRTKNGPVSVTSAAGTGDARHGVGTGSSVNFYWTAN